MPYQTKLLPANESAPWTSQQNRITLTIPSDIQACDLSKSSVVLDVACTTSGNGQELGLYDVQFKDGYEPSCLIRTAKIRTNKSGNIEEIQNANVLNMNLKAYNDSTEEQLSTAWVYEGQPNNPSIGGSLINKVHIGSTYSTQSTFMPIPLMKLFGVGQAKQWLNGGFDSTTIDLELEFNNDIISKAFQQTLMPAELIDDIPVGLQTSVDVTTPVENLGSVEWYVGQPVTVTSSANFTTVEPTNCSQANPCVITLAEKPSDIYIGVGSTVTITGAVGGGWAGLLNGDQNVTAIDDNALTMTLGAVDASGEGAQPTTYPEIVREASEQPTDDTTNTVISSIAVSSADKVTLSLADSVGYPVFASKDSTVEARASGDADTDLGYKINNAELRLVQWGLSGESMGKMASVLKKNISIPFNTWVCERVNLPIVGANMKYNRLIDVPANCKQVIIMAPIQSAVDPLKSDQDNQANYIFSLDTHYTTSRSIVPYDSLYYDRLINTFANSGQVLDNLAGASGRVLWCQDIPIDGNSHQLQYEYTQNGNAGTANKVMYIFQLLRKKISTQGGVSDDMQV